VAGSNQALRRDPFVSSQNLDTNQLPSESAAVPSPVTAVPFHRWRPARVEVGSQLGSQVVVGSSPEATMRNPDSNNRLPETRTQPPTQACCGTVAVRFLRLLVVLLVAIAAGSHWGVGTPGGETALPVARAAESDGETAFASPAPLPSGLRGALIGRPVWAQSGALTSPSVDSPVAETGHAARAGLVAAETTPAEDPISDMAIGNTRVGYIDPEFWTDPPAVTWSDRANFDIWIAQVNPANGQFIPADGRGTYVGRGVPVSPTARNALACYNGPEWGVSPAVGLSVYFTQFDTVGVGQIARYSFNERRVIQLTRGGDVMRGGVLPSDSLEGPFAGLVTLQLKGPLTPALGTSIAWRFENEPTVDRALPLAFGGSSVVRWVPGMLQLISNRFDSNGVAQVYLYDCLADTFQNLTSGPGNKYDAFLFYPPEYPGRRAFSCTIDASKIALYVENSAGQFEKLHEISAPQSGSGAFGKIYSAEPFIFRGKSGWAFSSTFGQINSDPSDVFVVQLGGFIRRVNVSTNPAVRSDPEVLILGNKLFLYYSEKRKESRIRLRLVTGLFGSGV
jgi:hypothetical protein